MSVKPELYLKTSAGYDYDFDYNVDLVDELQNLLNTIFSEEIKNYYLSILSFCYLFILSF